MERYNHRIQFLDPQGVSLGWVGDRGTVLEEQLAELQGTPQNLLASPLFELPTSIAKDSYGNYFITDSGNHRVARWNGIPSDDGEPPTLVMGQDNLEENEANRQGLVGSGSLFFPAGIFSGDDQHVFVADKDNHRVLIWKKIPFSDGWNADISLGQIGMDERDANRGDFDNVQQDTLSFPTGVFYDVENDKVFVVDQGNNRVLIWNRLPRDTGQPADVVIGQKDFISRSPNMGKGEGRASNESMYFPRDIVVGKMGMFVSDSGNNRVLYWKEVPTENGQPADMVFGQTNFYDNRHNRNGQANASTLNDPYGMWLEEEENPDWIPPEENTLEKTQEEDTLDESSFEEDTGEGTEKDKVKEEVPEYLFKLFIADRGNSRVVVWNELPIILTEKDEDDQDYIEIEDDNLLIGDDDDDDYLEEEGEDGSPEELPSV